MALPNFTAGHSLSTTMGSFRGQAAPTNGGSLEMSLNIGCLLGCGVKALGCITCGTSIPCWIGCAGPDAIKCVTGCF